jgi:hypothetical protein
VGSMVGGEATTLEQIFPGTVGRLKLIRVLLRLKMPELAKMDPNQTLAPALASQIRGTLVEIERGQ